MLRKCVGSAAALRPTLSIYGVRTRLWPITAREERFQENIHHFVRGPCESNCVFVLSSSYESVGFCAFRKLNAFFGMILFEVYICGCDFRAEIIYCLHSAGVSHYITEYPRS